MKNFIWIFLFVPVLVYSQNPLNEQEAKDCKCIDENYKDYFSNGQLRSTYTFKNGNLDGDYAIYYKNGKLQEIEHFENGHFHGKNMSYNSSGQLLTEEEYKHDTLLSYHGINYYYNGNKKSDYYIVFDKDSLKINPFIGAKNQKLRQFVYYDFALSIKKMKSHGIWMHFYRNGDFKSIYTLENDFCEGKGKEFLKDESYWIGPFHKDREDGLFTHYTANDEFIRTELWKEGKRVKEKK